MTMLSIHRANYATLRKQKPYKVKCIACWCDPGVTVCLTIATRSAMDLTLKMPLALHVFPLHGSRFYHPTSWISMFGEKDLTASLRCDFVDCTTERACSLASARCCCRCSGVNVKAFKKAAWVEWKTSSFINPFS